jgi:hypothetical protein
MARQQRQTPLKSVTIYLPARLVRQVERLAVWSITPTSGVIRHLIRRGLQTHGISVSDEEEAA